jgi:hypothetical protein
MMRVLSATALVGSMFLFTAAPAGAAALERHAGVVTAVEGGQITIDEMGPWLGPGTKPVRRVFEVTASTTIERIERARKGSQGWAWGYVSRPLEVSDIRPGDWVTVTIDREKRGQVVVEVEALRPGPNALD